MKTFIKGASCLLGMYVERDIEKDIVRWLESREILAIRGPRQSGKTTLLKRLVDILGKKHRKERIHYISLESDLERRRFESDPQRYIDYYLGGRGKHFFLLDEVQYVKDAGKVLKLLFDNNSAVKFIITGSSTLDLNQIGSYLVGRVLFFDLYPFSFSEFLKAKDKRLHAHYTKYRIPLQKPVLRDSLFIPELNGSLKEYLTFGGYPRVVLEESVEKKKFLLKNLFTTYIEKDVVALYGMKSKAKIISSVRCLASLIGNMLRYEELCTAGGLYHKEAKEILSILENTYVIQLVRPFHKNLVTELRKNPKVYFVDLGLRNAVLDRFTFSDEEFGRLLENHVLHLLQDASFWRTTAKAEVDFIERGGVPVEVKCTPRVTRSLRSYITTYSPPYGFILCRNAMEMKKVNSTKMYIVPACLV